MTFRNHRHPLPAAGVVLGCLLLTVCAGQTPTATNWVKSGADDQTIARGVGDVGAAVAPDGDAGWLDVRWRIETNGRVCRRRRHARERKRAVRRA